MSISLVQNRYLGYSSIALVVELSNIFLHLRQLFKIGGLDERSTAYLINRWVNLIAFVVLRGSIQIFLTSKLIVHKDSVPFSVFVAGALCVIAVTIMTVVLFYRLLQSEFGPKTTSNNSHRITNNEKDHIKKPKNGYANTDSQRHPNNEIKVKQTKNKTC